MSRDSRKGTECTFTFCLMRRPLICTSVAWSTRATDDEGGWQQYALATTSPYLTSKIPENISDDEAVTLPTGLNTAQVALYDKEGFGFPHPFKGGENFGKGKSILVLGGSSVIGYIGKPNKVKSH